MIKMENAGCSTLCLGFMGLGEPQLLALTIPGNIQEIWVPQLSITSVYKVCSQGPYTLTIDSLRVLCNGTLKRRINLQVKYHFCLLYCWSLVTGSVHIFAQEQQRQGKLGKEAHIPATTSGLCSQSSQVFYQSRWTKQMTGMIWTWKNHLYLPLYSHSPKDCLYLPIPIVLSFRSWWITEPEEGESWTLIH